jgi:hypothetical protein
MHGVRDVQCTCHNWKHRCYERRKAYAFTDSRGNVVVKKCKTLLLDMDEAEDEGEDEAEDEGGEVID